MEINSPIMAKKGVIMQEHSLEKLGALAKHAVQHPVLVILARSGKPTGAFKKAKSLGWPQRQAKATHHLAQIRRDFGPKVFETFITLNEHTRPKGTEHALEKKPMYRGREELSVVEQRLDDRLQKLRGEACRGCGAYFKRNEGSLASDVFLEFLHAMAECRLPEGLFQHLSKTSRPTLLAEVILKCRKVLGQLREERNLSAEEARENESREMQRKRRQLWWDAIVLVIADYGIEKHHNKYYTTSLNDLHFFDMLLTIQLSRYPSPAKLDEIIRDKFWGYYLDEEVMAKIRADFGEYMAGRIQNAPKPLTREEKIERVAQKIVADNWINPGIFQRALRDGGLCPWDGQDVMERAKAIVREKQAKAEEQPGTQIAE